MLIDLVDRAQIYKNRATFSSIMQKDSIRSINRVFFGEIANIK